VDITRAQRSRLNVGSAGYGLIVWTPRASIVYSIRTEIQINATILLGRNIHDDGAEKRCDGDRDASLFQGLAHCGCLKRLAGFQNTQWKFPTSQAITLAGNQENAAVIDDKNSAPCNCLPHVHATISDQQ
jgi:hypothetical protein